MSVGDVSYFDYSGVLMDAERRDKLRRALGPTNKVVTSRFTFYFSSIVLSSIDGSVVYVSENDISKFDARISTK